MATKSKDPATGTKKRSAPKPKAGNPTLASAASAAERKRSVKSAQQQQRAEAQPSRVMAAHDTEQRNRMVAEAAYFRAKMRDFTPGHELDDWLDAEAEIDRHGPAA
jgi:hypothetical protein